MAFNKAAEELFRVQNWGARDAFVAILSAWCTYWVTVGIYRVYFSPLAKFPGPKLAALTFWYEFYYEIYPHSYQYLWKIKALHEQYGPIIRISPYHIHVNDVNFFDKIYAAGNHKRNRDPWFSHSSPKSWAGAMLEAIDHDLHKMRRSAVSNFFSKRSVQALEPLVIDKAKRLVERLKEDGANGRVVNCNNAMAGMTMDVISAYCFGESMNALSKSEYGKQWLDILHQGVQIRPIARQFPTIMNFLLDLPPKTVAKMNPAVAMMNSFNESLINKISKIKENLDAGVEEKSEYGHRTIFHEMFESTVLREEEKLPFRMMGDASVFLGAGTETTARTLSVTIYYLLTQKRCGDKLRAELRTVLPSKDTKVTLPQLEALPYLTATINEGLRVAHGVTSRHFRIATEEDLQYQQYTIPRGTPVAESLYLLNTDEKTWPEPFKFRPERFIETPEVRKRLVSFGGGSRNCLGMNLAVSELYFALAYLFRELEMEVVDTIEEKDVMTSHDCFIGMSDLGSEGIKIKILGEVKD
ncbi:cytochrome P450 [Lophiotrema nucula]|uniref:Cytochrome P450 n=1 Tax=Lophiotrema nucula TaxID=690887 RepID=A0A6A5YZ70_9PLEO|nr:cytochrome P450 [Lophiotrema nucula]